MEVLEMLKIPKKRKELLKMTIKKTKARVQFQKITTDEFDVKKRVKQRDRIPPTLFNLVYADHLTIVANSKQEVTKAVEKQQQNLD